MPDHAISTHPAVQAQLDRLTRLSPGTDTLGLERITELLARLGDPHLALPPVFHVAGTNGKGSTCAFLRAALEAAGHAVHVYSSPHLVRFNERIRVAGRLIEDDALAALLAEVLDHAGGIGASFFEVTTAAAFVAFARTPAAACVIEVGLGGRLDATNVVRPLVTGIAQLGIDHQSFLGDTLAEIAAEKAGIAKPGVPLVTMRYPPPIAAVIAGAARATGAPLFPRGQDWTIEAGATEVRYRVSGVDIVTGRPQLAGAYQADNLGLAIAMLRHQDSLYVPDAALRAAAESATWPARMQRLGDGPLTARLRPEQRRRGVWLDGAHNPSAAEAIRDSWTGGAPTALVFGMLANKDAGEVLRHLVATSGACHVVAVPVPGHDHHPPDALAALAQAHGATSARTAASVEDAFDQLATLGVGESVLVAGSLYLAGEILAANGELPN